MRPEAAQRGSVAAAFDVGAPPPASPPAEPTQQALSALREALPRLPVPAGELRRTSRKVLAKPPPPVVHVVPGSAPAATRSAIVVVDEEGQVQECGDEAADMAEASAPDVDTA